MNGRSASVSAYQIRAVSDSEVYSVSASAPFSFRADYIFELCWQLIRQLVRTFRETVVSGVPLVCALSYLQ